MMFADYFFYKAFDGSVLMDKELKPESLDVKEGDVFVAHITEEKQIIFQKQKPE